MWIMVSADFPGIAEHDKKRLAIYECLKKKGWIKLPGVTTTWKIEYGSSGREASVAFKRVSARVLVRQAFQECAKIAGCVPGLAIMDGPSEPVEV